MNNIGEKIKNIRKSQGLTQKQLGEKLGISQALVNQYENGKRKPKVEQIQRIANALSVDLSELTEQITYNGTDYLNTYDNMVFIKPEKLNKVIELYKNETNRVNKQPTFCALIALGFDHDFIADNFENPFTDDEIEQLKKGNYDKDIQQLMDISPGFFAYFDKIKKSN